MSMPSSSRSTGSIGGKRRRREFSAWRLRSLLLMYPTVVRLEAAGSWKPRFFFPSARLGFSARLATTLPFFARGTFTFFRDDFTRVIGSPVSKTVRCKYIAGLGVVSINYNEPLYKAVGDVVFLKRACYYKH